jgi:predicted amidohydrolase
MSPLSRQATWRVAAVATPAWIPDSEIAWRRRLEELVTEAADGGARLVVFGEYITASLLALDPHWERWTKTWQSFATEVAQRHAVYVCAGTHLVHVGDRMYNRCAIASPDGSLRYQDKLHPTPWERDHVTATHHLQSFLIDGVRTAVLICYDSEFPEAARSAALAGAELLLVPSWTDDRAGFMRVRRCAAARCVENSCVVVHAPLVGGVPSLNGFETAVGSAALLTPCDDGFPTDGIAVESAWNQPQIAIRELDLAHLRAARTAGTVTPLTDFRPMSTYTVLPPT